MSRSRPSRRRFIQYLYSPIGKFEAEDFSIDMTITVDDILMLPIMHPISIYAGVEAVVECEWGVETHGCGVSQLGCLSTSVFP